MKRKLIGLLSAVLALTLLLAGCSRGTPEQQLEGIEKQLMEAKAVEGYVKISNELVPEDEDLEGLEMSVEIEGDVKIDKSKKFPAVDFRGKIGAMGMKMDVDLFLNENLFYTKAMEEEIVQEIDREMREQILSALEEGKAANFQIDREVTRKYEDRKQQLVVSYDVAQLNDQMRESMKELQNFGRQEQAARKPSEEKEEQASEEDDGFSIDPFEDVIILDEKNYTPPKLVEPEMPQVLFDKYELTYVVDRSGAVQEIKGDISVHMTIDRETAGMKMAFTFRLDKLGEGVQVTKPSYTTTTRRTRKTTERTDKEAKDDEEQKEKEGRTDGVQETTQARE